MLIKALCDYADAQKAKDIDIVSDIYSTQNVSFRIMLTMDGEISEIMDIRRKEMGIKKNGKEKELLRPNSIFLPKRTEKSAIESNIIEHRPLYIFGLNLDKGQDDQPTFTAYDKTEKAKKSHNAFVKRNLEFCGDIDSDIVRVYCRFIEKWKPEAQTSNPALLRYSKDYSGAYFCFGLSGEINCNLEDDEALRDKYSRMCQTMSEQDYEDKDMMFCPIEGEKLKPARIHDKIRGLKNASSTGAILVGMKEPSFESFGKKQSLNSGLSEKAMRKYTATLNKLLAEKNHRIFIDEMTLVFFAISNNDAKECDIFYQMMNGPEDENLDRNLSAIASQIAVGKSGDYSALEVNDGLIFYVIGLTPNSSRISQKVCVKNGFGQIIHNIMQHQADIAVKEDFRQVSVYQLLRELVSPKSSKEEIPPPFIADMISSILNGTQYPITLLETVIRRIKTDSDEDKNKYIKINDRRIGLIKAYLNRGARKKKEKEEIRMSLDKSNMSPAYLCGRLFAVLENTQSNALGDVNRTIKDAYFTSACTRPAILFPKLLQLSQSHFKKLQRDKFPFYKKNREIQQEIMNGLSNEFPSRLSLEDQGRFIIGYFHQVDDIFTKKTDTPNNNEAKEA